MTEQSQPDGSEQNADVVHSIKGFNHDWTCRGFQFTPGQAYEHDGAIKLCESGFHAVAGHPLEVFMHYPPGTSRYAEVAQSGTLLRTNGGKITSSKIAIGVELHLHEIIERAVKWALDHAKGKSSVAIDARSVASTTDARGAVRVTGYQGIAGATGVWSVANATGAWGIAGATGDWGAASATGDQSAAVTTGTDSASNATGARSAAMSMGRKSSASAIGNHSVAVATGLQGRVMGRKGCALFLVHRDPYSGKILHTWSGIVGRDGIKPDVWYTLDDHGQPVEATP